MIRLIEPSAMMTGSGIPPRFGVNKSTKHAGFGNPNFMVSGNQTCLFASGFGQKWPVKARVLYQKSSNFQGHSNLLIVKFKFRESDKLRKVLKGTLFLLGSNQNGLFKQKLESLG